MSRNRSNRRNLKLIAILLAFALLLPCIPSQAAASLYSDISGHWAEDAIIRWTGYGILQGSDGRFRPDEPISRAELAVLINKIFSFPESNRSFFTDAADKWYESDLNAIAMQGIYIETKGNSYGDWAVTREEAVEMLYRAFCYPNDSGYYSGGLPFLDGDDISQEYLLAICVFKSHSIIGGFPDGTFRPKEHFTRASIVSILNNLIGLYITEPGEYYIQERTNVLVAAPDVTILGKYVSYLFLLPAAAESITTLSYAPYFGCFVWGGGKTFKYWEQLNTGGLSLSGSSVYYRQVIPSVDTFFAGGAGLSLAPYLIENELQLHHLESYLSDEYSDMHFSLNSDIVMSSDWTPIGHQVHPDVPKSYDDYIFRGTLDGNGHSIGRMNINYKGNDIRYFGLFSYLGGIVRNLNVNGSINVESVASGASEELDHFHVGSITGRTVRQAVVENCNVDVTITVTGPCRHWVGGIVGENAVGNIRNCSASGTITVSSSTSKDYCNTSAGGIVGVMATYANSSIENCCSDADVTAIGGSSSFAGGIIGLTGPNLNTIKSCFASGTIKAQDAELQNNAGGIAGQLNGATSTIRECGSAANVSASGNPRYFNAVGGIAGSAYESSNIINCYSSGPVSATGFASIGGIVGRAECIISTSYTTSEISASHNLGNPAVNGLLGTVRGDFSVRGCGVFNVSDLHFVFTDVGAGIAYLHLVEDRSLSSMETYLELGRLDHPSIGVTWDFETIWTFPATSANAYPILRSIPVEVQEHNQ